MNRLNCFTRTHPLRLALTLLTLLLLCPAVTLAAPEDAPVSIVTQAMVEQKIATEEGRLEVQRVPASKALPGDTVTFINTVTNNSDSAAESIAVSNPIPGNMLFVAGSATGEKTTITFSVDGGESYDRPERLTVTGADGNSRPATPADYTDIRWLFTIPLQAGAAEQVEFQAQVK
jgi:uncharacterized repeat protein (TIGR01451 family)